MQLHTLVQLVSQLRVSRVAPRHDGSTAGCLAWSPIWVGAAVSGSGPHITFEAYDENPENARRVAVLRWRARVRRDVPTDESRLEYSEPEGG